jgi:hypothetical protein
VHIDIGQLSLALSPRLKVHLWDDDKMADSLRYKDKVIIVTGGSSGIGKRCVKVFGKIPIWVIYTSSITLLINIVIQYQICIHSQRRIFSKYGISYYMFTMADVNIHASNRQIWHRHPNKENTGNDVMEQRPRFFALVYRVSEACIYQ